MAYYRFVGSTSPLDNISYLILETDENGNATRTVGIGGVARMTKAEVDRLDRYVFEQATKDDMTETETSEPVVTKGTEVAGGGLATPSSTGTMTTGAP